MSGAHVHPRGNDGADIVDDVGTQFAGSSQRFTATRRALVAVLADADGPLSIPEILEATDDLAQSSVYRNLTVLEEAGVVVRVAGVDDRVRYELGEHLTGHHHHLVCTSCGAVADVRIPDALEQDLERVLTRLAGGAGFSVEGHRLDLLGRCAACR
jgi:Fe2+ or Zn2+ uptake regulation protein